MLNRLKLTKLYKNLIIDEIYMKQWCRSNLIETFL